MRDVRKGVVAAAVLGLVLASCTGNSHQRQLSPFEQAKAQADAIAGTTPTTAPAATDRCGR